MKRHLKPKPAPLAVGETLPAACDAHAVARAFGISLNSVYDWHRDGTMPMDLWGAVGGASAALGPVVGGFLTSNASWRWSFGLNVIGYVEPKPGAGISFTSRCPHVVRLRA